MKLAFALAASMSLAACSAKTSSSGSPTPQDLPYELADSPATQELKVVGIIADTDGVNKVEVTKPSTAAREFVLTVDAKETGKVELQFEGYVEIGCTDGQLAVNKFWEDVTGGNVQSSAPAGDVVPMIAGHSYRLRYSITAGGACEGYSEQFKAVFSAGAVNPSGPTDPSQPDSPAEDNACATASDIGLFFARASAGEWCVHTVTQPASGIANGRPISSGGRFATGTKLAIFAGKMGFAQAASACAKIGSGWALPLSQEEDASPRASASGKSAEAAGLYLANMRYATVWSGSSVESQNSGSAWMTDLAAGGAMFHADKSETMSVVCVK